MSNEEEFGITRTDNGWLARADLPYFHRLQHFGKLSSALEAINRWWKESRYGNKRFD